MLKLGLTGSIASGKSTVLAMLGELGAATFSSDATVHQLYAGEAAPIVERLFPGVVRDGAVDRHELARRLVGRPERLRVLEAAVHPLVRQRIAAFLESAVRSGAAIAVVDVPLLYENGVDWGLDGVIVTAAGDAELRRRALLRPGMTVEKLDAILARQLPEAEKLARADYVIDTSGTLDETEAQVKSLVESLRLKGSRR